MLRQAPRRFGDAAAAPWAARKHSGSGAAGVVVRDPQRLAGLIHGDPVRVLPWL